MEILGYLAMAALAWLLAGIAVGAVYTCEIARLAGHPVGLARVVRTMVRRCMYGTSAFYIIALWPDLPDDEYNPGLPYLMLVAPDGSELRMSNEDFPYGMSEDALGETMVSARVLRLEPKSEVGGGDG